MRRVTRGKVLQAQRRCSYHWQWRNSLLSPDAGGIRSHRQRLPYERRNHSRRLLRNRTGVYCSAEKYAEITKQPPLSGHSQNSKTDLWLQSQVGFLYCFVAAAKTPSDGSTVGTADQDRKRFKNRQEVTFFCDQEIVPHNALRLYFSYKPHEMHGVP